MYIASNQALIKKENRLSDLVPCVIYLVKISFTTHI